MLKTIMTSRSKIILSTVLLYTLVQTANGFSASRTFQVQKALQLQNHDVFKSNRSFPSISSSPPSTSTSSSASTSLNAIPLDLGLEDIIYQAQSTASKLASVSINSSSTTSLSSLAVLYFAGLLTSFSPCSLGLLPLTISYISNAAGEREDKAVLFPTIFFALGLASVFCGLGLSVAFLGGVFGSSSSLSTTTLGSILLALFSSGVSITMGLQLLEIVNIPLPSIEIGSFSTATAAATATMTTGGETTSSTVTSPSNINCSDGMCSQISYNEEGEIISNENNSGNNQNNKQSTGGNNGSSLFRTFLLGGSSALVASPCATPVLTSILGFVAASRDPVLGAVLLLTYTIGYSTPLLVIGASGGQALANAQMAASSEEDSLLAKIGVFVNPLTASILIWYGTNGLLEALFGDPSMFALSPVLDDFY